MYVFLLQTHPGGGNSEALEHLLECAMEKVGCPSPSTAAIKTMSGDGGDDVVFTAKLNSHGEMEESVQGGDMGDMGWDLL